MVQEKKGHKKSKRKPSAMAQVHNRVNAGVMDGVVYGGMMETARPEHNKYKLGFEKGGFEPYGHAIDESTDSVTFGGGRLTCYDYGAVPFISFIKKDGSRTRMFVGANGELHSTMPAVLLSNGDIKKDDFGSLWDIKRDEKRSGRVWITKDCTVISFYSYPNSIKKIYDYCVEALLAVQETTGKDFNIGETMVDLWTKNVRNPIIMPVRWFNNGTAEIFLPITEKCEPYENFDGTFRYRLSTSKGNFTADWKGDDIEQEEEYGALRESKEMTNKVDYNKYIKSLIEFMREQHLRIDPLPEIELNPEKQDGIFVKTGYYSPEERKVVVFTDGRHPKDVLRTVAHEFIHHMQNLQNPDKDWGTGGDLEADRKLRGIEGEAFLLGNIIFREWTEKMRKTRELNESRLAESPDAILGDGFRLYWGDETSVPFMSFGLPGEERKFYVGKSDETHTDMIGKVMRELGEDPEEYGSCRTDFDDGDCLDMEMTGRYWGSANIISFWDTPRNNREKLEKTVSNLIHKGVDIRDGLLVDLWDEQADFKKNDASCLVPYKWFFNGAYQVFRGLGMTRSLPEGDGLFKVTFGDGAKKTVDKNGRFVEKAYSLNESKKRKKQVKNDEGELVPETCDKCGGKVVCQIHGEPVYVCKDCGKYFGTMPCNLNEAFDVKKALKNLKKRRDPANIENWDRIDEIETEIIEPDDVDLSSFNIKKHLNPKFWDDGHLDTRIRLRLLDIADDFFHFLDVDWVEPEDVIITGSLANYNWNDKYSDIDLHVLVDYEDVDERVDFVREYFTLKKNEWNEKHKGLKIFGFPVEVYVQDSNEPHASSGVYSIDRDEWIEEPDRDKIRSGKVDKRHIREMVSTYMNKIDALIDIYKHHKDDEYEMRKVSEDAAEMMDEIRKMRKDDLAKYGREMCDGNIIFKALRRSDYIGKLAKLKNLAYDKINSM